MTMAIWFNGAACGAVVASAFIALLLSMAAWNRRAASARNGRGVGNG